jgi:hypothetical protein
VWTGTTPSFISTTIDLPTAAVGQNIKLRWRVGTDNSSTVDSYFAGGWYVDTISITKPTGYTCCGGETSACPLNENVEAGAGTFAINNGFGVGNGLWHLSTACQSGTTGHTAPTTFCRPGLRGKTTSRPWKSHRTVPHTLPSGETIPLQMLSG